MLNFKKIRPLGAELFHADRQTDKHDEGNSIFFSSQFLRTRLKKTYTTLFKGSKFLNVEEIN